MKMKKIVAVGIMAYATLTTTIQLDASCANPGWKYGYYKNKIIINAVKLSSFYANITRQSINDWNQKNTGYTLDITFVPQSDYGTGEGTIYAIESSLTNSAVAGRTVTLIYDSNKNMRAGKAYHIIYNTTSQGLNGLSDSQKERYSRSVMGHELGHVMSLGDMDKNGTNTFGTQSIMSYGRNRLSLYSPTNLDASWVMYFK